MFVTEDVDEADAVVNGVLAPALGRPPDELRERLPIGPTREYAEKLARLAGADTERILV